MMRRESFTIKRNTPNLSLIIAIDDVTGITDTGSNNNKNEKLIN
jgi:hypothetical protein